MTHSTSSTGFTLLELMVALLLFCLVALGANHLLHSVVRARDESQARSQQMAQLQKALVILQQDAMQMDFLTVGNYTGNYTRRGWSNPLQFPRSEMLEVGYSLRDQTLMRYSRPLDNQAQALQPQELLKGVTNLHIGFISPRALEITFITESFGSIREVVEVPDYGQPDD